MPSKTEPDLPAYLGQYDWSGPWEAFAAESGMNNTTRMITCGSARFVLRIYDNHKDHNKVLLEHAILAALGEAPPSGILVPVPVRNRFGGTVTIGPGDKLAALYHYIPGERTSAAAPAHVTGLGAATGQLTQALARIELPLQPIYQPYFQLEDDYRELDSSQLLNLARGSNLLHDQASLVEELQAERSAIARLTPEMSKLPIQWIHGDLVFNNALASGEEVIGILDFEYCTQDLRAMELGVVLAEFIGPDTEHTLQQMRRFIQGYQSAVSLLPEEIELLPALIKLRMLDVWLHFANRYLEGLDEAEVWSGQIARAAEVCRWVNTHDQALINLFH
ncbi:phosphotransferase [Paenibacillus daejeonensis]|uniref:phosphotransferase n=1 Tax=Paenibacillus daejeonensis TaxID=135193 RepID=UPI0003741D02|nr:phosphotransferase [Paenibacillus daejeonensis]